MLYGKLSGAETVDLRERWPVEVNGCTGRHYVHSALVVLLQKHHAHKFFLI